MMKIAVIGVGSMGQNHARVLFNLDEAQLAAVADMDIISAQKIAQKYNVKAYKDYKEMLDLEEIDAVSIAVPTRFHKDVAIYALEKGKHVLLEKPIASNEVEAQEIIACARRNNCKLMIGHIERFNPAIQELKKRVEELGEIYKIDVQRIGSFPARIADVGVIVDLSVHDIDIVNYLLNSRIKRIYAEKQQKLHASHEDSVTALITYTNDVLAVLNINYLSPTKTRLLKVFGKKGMFLVNYLEQELFFYENSGFSSTDWNSVREGDMHKITIAKKEPLVAEIEAFVRCIRENCEPDVNGEHGLEVLKTAQTIHKSAYENKIIEL